jgi:hypothetical protein
MRAKYALPAILLTLSGCATAVYSQEPILKNHIYYCNKKKEKPVDVSQSVESFQRKAVKEDDQIFSEEDSAHSMPVYKNEPRTGNGLLDLEDHDCEANTVNDNDYELHGIKEWEFNR